MLSRLIEKLRWRFGLRWMHRRPSRFHIVKRDGFLYIEPRNPA